MTDRRESPRCSADRHPTLLDLSIVAASDRELDVDVLCDGCRNHLAGFRSLLGILEENSSSVFEPARGGPRTRRRRHPSSGAALALLLTAACCVLAVGLHLSPVPQSAATSSRGATRPLDVEVTGDATGRIGLHWLPVPGAASYVVSTWTSLGDRIEDDVQLDAPCDCSVILTAGEPGSKGLVWRVAALDLGDRLLAVATGRVGERAP